MSFRALYSPKFKMKDNAVFFDVVADMKKFSSYIQNCKGRKSEDFVPLLNLLPALKIIVIKCGDILISEDYM